MIRPFGGQNAGVEFKIFNLERFLAEESVAGEKIGDLLNRTVFQAGKSDVR